MPITETMAANIRATLNKMHEQDQQRQEMAWALVSACWGRQWEVERYIYKALSMYREQEQEIQEESNAQVD